jgi:transcriptional regulator with XRE-family HTH domain
MKEGSLMRVSKRLRIALKESRYSLREISKQTGISVSTLVDWQSGRSPRDFEKLCRLAHFLGLSLHEILFGIPDPMEARVSADWLISQIASGQFDIVLKSKNSK